MWDLLDCVDGDLAMYKNMQSKYGAFLEGVFDFSLGRLAGPLAFSVSIAYFTQAPDHILYVVLATGFLIFSDRFFHLSIAHKNELFGLSSSNRDPDKQLENSYTVGKKIHSVFLYYEFQIASCLLLISSALGMYSLLPLVLISFGSLYFILGMGVFIFVRQYND
jgi:phosphatidylglycerophosphate synthase